MGRGEKNAYLEAVRPRYRKASRQQKKVILDEMTSTLGCHRKAVICMRRDRTQKKQVISSTTRPLRQVGRPNSVTASDARLLKRLAECCEWPCGKRFKAMMPLWIGFDEARYGDYEQGQREHLMTLSAATLDRHLGPIRKAAGIKGRSGTKPGSLLREQIPIRSGPWDVSEPGYIEADTVAHCGHSLAGQFAWTLTMTDIHTTWTECRAVWNKGKFAVRDAVIDVDGALPFTILGFDCDNGSEFLNKTLTKYFQTHPAGPSLRALGPTKKMTTRMSNKKNWTHARQLWGYQRIDSRERVEPMNELYRNEVSWINNLFTPSMKLISKERVAPR